MNDSPIYHQKRLKKTYNQALAVALLKYKQTKTQLAEEIILKLINVGAKLSDSYDNVSVNNDTPCNNLQFIVNNNLASLLKTILKNKDKMECSFDILKSINDVSSEKENSESILTTTLMRYKSNTDMIALEMALELIRAEAKLSLIRKNSPYPQYNNFIINTKVWTYRVID